MFRRESAFVLNSTMHLADMSSWLRELGYDRVFRATRPREVPIEIECARTEGRGFAVVKPRVVLHNVIILPNLGPRSRLALIQFRVPATGSFSGYTDLHSAYWESFQLTEVTESFLIRSLEVLFAPTSVSELMGLDSASVGL